VVAGILLTPAAEFPFDPLRRNVPRPGSACRGPAKLSGSIKNARAIKALSQTSPCRANILVVIGHDS
jgi:hypothetical protein